MGLRNYDSARAVILAPEGLVIARPIGHSSCGSGAAVSYDCARSVLASGYDMTVELAKSWVLMHKSKSGSHDYEENFWAFAKLYKLCDEAPDQGLEIIEEIVRIDSSDIILANIAAGPMEELLVKHGTQFIDKIERLAATDEKFRKMLGAMWKNEIADEVWARVQRVAGPTF
jgi:hypothetical protein